MKIVLCGYNWTGCEALRQLLAMGHEVFVFTHENEFHIPSLLEYCRTEKVPYSTDKIAPGKLPFAPDCIASIYYRYIIKQNIIDACEGRIFNLHPSLLPAYRGCSSLTWAMIDGQQEVGFTYHYIDAGCDTGDIIHQGKVAVHAFDNQATLYQRVGFEAMKAFSISLDAVLSGRPGTPQVGPSSYFPRGCPHEGNISPNWPEEKVERFIRAMIHPPYPVAKYCGASVRSMSEYRRLRHSEAA